MMYLASNSRPEIQFSVQKCASFLHNYWESHEDAIIRICRYHRDTQKKGLLIIPTRKLRVKCYVDSDFAGLSSYKDLHNPVCAISRSGYVVTFSNCPILWVSRLQTKIYLSTLQTDYVEL